MDSDSARQEIGALAAFWARQSETRQVAEQVRRSTRDRSSSGAAQRVQDLVFIGGP